LETVVSKVWTVRMCSLRVSHGAKPLLKSTVNNGTSSGNFMEFVRRRGRCRKILGPPGNPCDWRDQSHRMWDGPPTRAKKSRRRIDGGSRLKRDHHVDEKKTTKHAVGEPSGKRLAKWFRGLAFAVRLIPPNKESKSRVGKD